MKYTPALALLFCSFALGACKKEPGPGGLAQIRGTIFRQHINNNTGVPDDDPYPYMEADVYIRYGDHDYYDDKTNTNPNGLYTFTWLRPGDYTIFVYSETGNCTDCKKAIEQKVTISGSEDVVTVSNITVDNW